MQRVLLHLLGNMHDVGRGVFLRGRIQIPVTTQGWFARVVQNSSLMFCTAIIQATMRGYVSSLDVPFVCFTSAPIIDTYSAWVIIPSAYNMAP